MARGRRKVGAMNFGYGSFADETLQTTVQGFQDQVYSQVNFSRSQELEKRSGREWHTWWIWQTRRYLVLLGCYVFLMHHIPITFWTTFSVVRVVVDQL